MIKDYQRLYNKMISAKTHDEHKCISLFGYNYEEILKMIKAYEANVFTIKNEEYKMTRDEAIKKIEDYGNNAPNWLINSLEALGLIKFDEEKYVPSPSCIIKDELFDLVNKPMHKADDIINKLMKAGYLIVRKDNAP